MSFSFSNWSYSDCRYFANAKLQKNIDVDKDLCLVAYNKIILLDQKYETIRCKKPPRGLKLSMAVVISGVWARFCVAWLSARLGSGGVLHPN